MNKNNYIKPQIDFVNVRLDVEILDVIEPGSNQEFSNKSTFDVEEETIPDVEGSTLWDD